MKPEMTPFRRGQLDFYQDTCENAPLACLGAKIQGEVPDLLTAPDWIPEADRAEWMKGYMSGVEEFGGCYFCASANVNDKRIKQNRGSSEYRRTCTNCGKQKIYTKKNPRKAK